MVPLAEAVALSDTPSFTRTVPGCLSEHIDHPASCAEPRARLIDAAHQTAEQHAVEAAGGRYIDVSSWVCPDTMCQGMYGDLLMYRDQQHLSTTMSAALATTLGDALTGSARK